MERIRRQLMGLVDEGELRRRDRRNNAILVAFGLPILVVSVTASLAATEWLPEMWSELTVIAILGILYNWAIRKQSIDLRLGLVYTGVGVLLSFPVLLVGLIGSVLTAVYVPVPEHSLLDALEFLPFGLAALAVLKLAEPTGMRVATKQWQSIRRQDLEPEGGPTNPSAVYLGDKKWTDSWFYLFFFAAVELVPMLLLHEVSLSTLATAALALGALIVYSGRAYYILRREQKRLVLPL